MTDKGKPRITQPAKGTPAGQGKILFGGGKKPTTPGVLRRSPIQVLTGLAVA